MRVEGYYKDFDRLVLGRLETPAEVAARVATYDFPEELAYGIPTAPQVTTMPANIGTGRAYGVEFYAEKRATSAGTRLSGWASYTLGRAETTAYGGTFAADYDRRHALSVVSSFRLSRLIEIGTTFRAQSGFPHTPGARGTAGIDRGSGRGRRGRHASGAAIRQPRTAGVVGRLTVIRRTSIPRACRSSRVSTRA